MKMFKLGLALVGLSFVMFASCTSDELKRVRERGQCQQNLGVVFEALVSYSRKHAEFPLDKNGQVDLESVFSEESKSSAYCCPSSQSGIGYVFKRNLAPKDLFRGERTLVFAMDAFINHPTNPPNDRGDREFVNLAYCGGLIVTMLVDSATAESWRETLRNGELVELK